MRRSAGRRGLTALAVALPFTCLLVVGGAHRVGAQLPLPCSALLGPPLCTPTQATPAPLLPGLVGPAPAPTAKASPPSPTPTPRPVASGALAVTGVIDDPALASKVTEVLQNPTSSERPSLLHFKAASRASGGSSRAVAGSGVSRWAIAGLLTVLIAMAALVAALLYIRRTSRRSLRVQLPRPRMLSTMSRRIAAVGLILPAAVIFAGFAVPAATRSVTAPVSQVPAAAVATTVDALHTDPITRTAHAAETAQSAGWSRLVTIESGLEAQRQNLVKQEAHVSELTAQLQREPVGSSHTGELLNQLQGMLGLHQMSTAAYEGLLQSEYEFFQSAVQSVPQRRDLMATAVASGQPDAGAAVKYNLDAVEAQQNQESALSTAEAQQPSTDPISALLHSAGRPTLISPMGGSVEQGFGPTSLSIEPPVTHNGRFYSHFHTGIDISAPMDSPVHAAAAGRVILATASVGDGGQLVGYGRYVAISHGNGFTTVYGHLDNISVHVGELVQQGDVIGHEGSTGNSTGPHLHFETRVNGSPVDPAPYLKGALHLR